MLRGVVVFLLGIYAGLYLDQRFEVPKVDDPKALYEKALEFLEKYKKENPKKD